jgi:hypothetical protein
MKNPEDEAADLDSLYEKIDVEELLTTELSSQEAELLSHIDGDPALQMSIEQLLNDIDGLDTAQVQSKLLLLLHQVFKARIKDKEMLRSFLKKREKVINDHLRNLSLYVMQTRSKTIRDASRNIVAKSDKYEYLTQGSRDNLRKIIRRFAVYEIYKFINPHRIAGETRKENFVHNMILGGMKRASRYEGGTKKELKSYSPSFIRNLEKQHKSFKRGNNKGMML